MLKFCFPERDPETIDGDGPDDLDADSKGKKLKGTKKSKETNFYVPIEQKDDVEKMKVKYGLPPVWKLQIKYEVVSLIMRSIFFIKHMVDGIWI
jgi:hypothetical protein